MPIRIAICIIFPLILLGLIENAAAGEGAQVIYLKGVVKVQHEGDAFWIFAKKGLPLNDSDKIKTFLGGEIEIALDPSLKNIVRLQPNTEISIKSLKEKQVYMPKGKVLSVVEALPEGSSFEVRTPTAVTGVAGSGMSVDTDGEKTYVSCFEDKAYVKGVQHDGTPMAAIFLIDEGHKRMVSRFDVPGDLAILTALERRNWTEFRENLREHINNLREKRSEGSRAAALELYEIDKLGRRK